MQLQEDDIILVKFKGGIIAPIIKKKQWYEKNKDVLLQDGWRIADKAEFKEIIKANEIEPFKKVRKKKTEPLEGEE